MTQQTAATTLIRGGQTTQHWWRMGLQVFRFATVVAALVYALISAALILYDFSYDKMRIAFYYEMAERGIEQQNGFKKPYTFRNLTGQTVTMDAVQLVRDKTFGAVRDAFFERVRWSVNISMLPALVAGIIALAVFIRTGDRVQEDEFVRGAQLIPAKELRRWSERAWKDYTKRHKGRKTSRPLTISGIPFPPNAVEAQTGLYGTVGVGKSNAMIEMLATIRENGGKAIIYDRMGTFVSRFYDEETDVILNPFDNRSVCWNPFLDVVDAASFAQLAEVMIPEHRGSGDPFWSQAARVVFEYAARQLHKRGNARVSDLFDYILQLPLEKLTELLARTPGEHFFNESIEKTAQSIRSNLIAELRFLEFLREDGPAFSARRWMNDDAPSFLFLTGDAEHAKATRNIISSVFEVSANGLMARGPATEPRCYFFMDELPTLNRLPFLVSSLAEIRQFGGAFVLGFQVYSQLQDIYGREAAQTISGTVNNRIVFNTPDFQTAKFCSESLGSMDTIEKSANISVGAHEARDGVGFQQNRVERPLVTHSQIQVLPQFQAYVKFAYAAPTALLKFGVANVPQKAPAFLPYMGKARGFEGFEDAPKPVEPPKPDADAREDVDTLQAEFRDWLAMHFPVAQEKWFVFSGTPPASYQIYWPYFRDRRRAGDDRLSIKPLVVVQDGLMRNVPRAKAAANPLPEEPSVRPPEPPMLLADAEPNQTPAPCRHEPAPVPAAGTAGDPAVTTQASVSADDAPRVMDPPEPSAASSDTELRRQDPAEQVALDLPESWIIVTEGE